VKHAKLGASKSRRWMNCPGSVQAEDATEHSAGSSIFASEGTAAHSLGEMCLRNGENAADHMGETFIADSHDFEVDEDMVEAVQVYLDAVRGVTTDDTMLMLEQKLSLDSIAPTDLQDEFFGTSDATVFNPGQKLLTVFDYKHGRGVVVEVKGNSQLRYYGLGALLAFEEQHPEFAEIVDTIELVIVQPRASHPDGSVRRENVSYLDLLGFAQELIDSGRETKKPNAPRTAGDWCRFCRASAQCPERARAALAVVQVDFADAPTSVPPAPETLPMDVLLDVLGNADVLEDWIRAVRSFVQAKLEAGENVPGYKLVAKRSNRKLVDEQAAINYVLTFGLDEKEVYTEPKVKSPAQLEKALRSFGFKGKKAKLPEELVVKPHTGYTLAPANDQRPALAPAVDEFFE